ncbi:hypothetical protein D3C81_08600 [compost metagenome]
MILYYLENILQRGESEVSSLEELVTRFTSWTYPIYMVCDLTKELDICCTRDISGLDTYSYLMTEFIGDKLPIRVPGHTIGCIQIDENFKIIDITLDANLKGFQADVYECLQKYIGKKLVVPKGVYCDHYQRDVSKFNCEYTISFAKEDVVHKKKLTSRVKASTGDYAKSIVSERIREAFKTTTSTLVGIEFNLVLKEL